MPDGNGSKSGNGSASRNRTARAAGSRTARSAGKAAGKAAGKTTSRAQRGGAAGGERRTANTAGGGSSRGGIGVPGSRPGDAMDAKVADLFGAGRTPPPDTARAADRGQPPAPLSAESAADPLSPEEFPDDGGATGEENDAARRRRRAQFLRDLNEAKELRDRVQPRRARAARMRQAMRMRTFRW